MEKENRTVQYQAINISNFALSIQFFEPIGEGK